MLNSYVNKMFENRSKIIHNKNTYPNNLNRVFDYVQNSLISIYVYNT